MDNPRNSTQEVDATSFGFFKDERKLVTHLEDTATSSAFKDVELWVVDGSAIAEALALLPDELRPGNAALKSAMSSSGGFCEFLLETRVLVMCCRKKSGPS
jgi:hypothetical protein